MAFSQLTIGRLAAVITVFIRTSFIILVRASASHVLLPLDIACARILGASSVLLPWAWWLMREARQRGEHVGSLFGLSPLPLHITVRVGMVGGLLYAVRATMAITAFVLVSFVPAYALLVNLNVLPSHMAQASWSEIVFQAVFQGVCSVVISGITFTQMIHAFGPVKSTMITALMPGFSALGAVVFLGEPLSCNLGAGLALVTGGILFGVRQAVIKS